MALAKAERQRAEVACLQVRNRDMVQPFFSGAVTFLVHRKRRIDPTNNVSSLKHMQDGVVKVFLPEGDGPTAPYKWIFGQVTRKEPGVMVTIEAAE